MAESRSPLDLTPALALLARCRFPPADADVEVSCAVSGGADSTALAVLAVTGGLRPLLIHVDHGTRPGSATEADIVARLAADLGCPFRAERVSVTAGPNFESRARAARYAALPAGVMTGHTLDDQAETVLLNLMRGAGLAGLAGMDPDGTRVRRPILALRRSETVALCSALGLPIVEDPSNGDPAHRRNRVRHELLPLLDDIADRDVAAILARQADLLRDDLGALDELADAIDPTDARAVATADPAVARRAVRAWLAGFDPDGHPPDAATVERALAVARGASPRCDLVAGRRLRRHRQRLIVE